MDSNFEKLLGADAAGSTVIMAPDDGLTASLADLDPAAIGELDLDPELLEALAARIEDTTTDGGTAAPLDLGDAMVALRRLPAWSTRVEGAIPAWTTGLAAEKRLGPIRDRIGRDVFIDVFRRVRQLRFVRTAGGAPFLTLPITQGGGLISFGTIKAGQTIKLARGSLWFATGLVSAAPDGVYTGLRIDKGSLRIGVDIVAGNDEIVVPAAASIVLSITLAPPKPGSAMADVSMKFPKEIDISVTPGALSARVTSGATLELWANNLELTPSTKPTVYRADLNRLILPMDDAGESVVGDASSTTFTVSGTAQVLGGGLALPAATISAADLGEASGVGALFVATGPGLSARWYGQGTPAALGRTLILVDSERLAVTGLDVKGGSPATRLAIAGPSAVPKPGTASWALAGGVVNYFALADGSEAVTATAAAELAFAQPVDVAGNRVGARLPAALVAVIDRPDGTRTLSIFGVAKVPMPLRPIAFALTNAVMRASPPVAMAMIAEIVDDVVAKGEVFAFYALGGLLPSLPDPYATNAGMGRSFDRGWRGLLRSSLRFDATAMNLAFALPRDLMFGDVPPPGSVATTSDPPTRDEKTRASAERAIGDALAIEKQSKIVLLDVSTNASRFGVALRPPTGQERELVAGPGGAPFKPLQVKDLDLAADARFMVLMTLPAVQWEPVRNEPNPAAPFPDEVRFANSGVPTTVDVPGVELVPVNPLAAYRDVVANFAKAAPLPSAMRFTLPFGMVAKARLTPPVGGRGATLGEIRPETADLKGAHQLRIEAADPTLGTGQTPALPGFTAQLVNAIATDGSGAQSILGASPTQIFNDALGQGGTSPLVPVTRIDLSGHGQSLFSDWANPDDPETGVTKAEFQVANGRASHEVVQVKSIKAPYWTPVVRTITLERKGNAVFTRYDSGWIPVGDGVYRPSPSSPVVTHPGVVTRATRVTNIRETGETVTVNGADFAAVYFDADLVIDGAAQPVPARRQIGYVKLSTSPLDSATYAALIAEVGTMGGPIDATIAIGGGRQRMRLHRVGVGTAITEFAMAAWGSLVFPGGGEWSVLEADDALGAPGPVASDRGLPLIRQGPAGTASTFPYRFADPGDLFDPGSPARDYGIMHGMGTQRAFFRRPRIEPSSPHRIVSTERPVLADPLILATAVGPFPKQADAIPFPSNAYAFEARPDGSWHLDPPQNFVASVPRRTVREAGTVKSDLDYSAATVVYAVDTALGQAWEFKLGNAVKIMNHTTLGDVMTVTSAFDAAAGRTTRFARPGLALGGPFDIVNDLLTIMKSLGIDSSPDVSMTNAWSLKIALTVPFVDATGDAFKVIPFEPLPTIIFEDTGVKVEFEVAPSADSASLELGGTPMFAIKAVPGLYAVAIIKFSMKLSTKDGTTYGVLIGVGIAYKLEAGPFELKGLFAITFFAVFGDTVLGYGVGFLVKVSLDLSPIVSVEISLEGKLARLAVTSSPLNTTVFLVAKLMFAIEVSIFLVFSISLEVETKQVDVLSGLLPASACPDVL